MTLAIWRGPDAKRQLESQAGEVDVANTALLPSPPVLDGQRRLIDQALEVAVAHGLTEPPPLADFVVDLLDADELLGKPTWHFSRGEQQIAGLVLVFARPFERLILVDPTAGLDGRRARDLAFFLAELGLDFDIDVLSEADVFDPYCP